MVYSRTGQLHWEKEKIKLGGDKGGGSFKFMMEMANVKNPNSKYNTFVICAFEASDSPVNLHMALDKYKDQIESIASTTCR